MIEGLHPVLQGLIGTLFTWFVTALGSAFVFVFPENMSNETEDKILTTSLGFAGGVMLAASYWSLLAPAIELSEELGYGELKWLPPTIGFLVGATFVHLADAFLPTPDITSVLKKNDDANKTSARTWRRVFLLVIAITVHNIPEGLAVGVGFGAVGSTESATFARAKHLAIGIGIQNFPEGLAVSLPLRRCGFSNWDSFVWGQLSGMVEPVAGVLGAYLVWHMQSLLPYFLSFAAGAMIYVVVDDIVPETSHSKHAKMASIGCMVGLVVMMSLDVGLG